MQIASPKQYLMKSESSIVILVEFSFNKVYRKYTEVKEKLLGLQELF